MYKNPLLINNKLNKLYKNPFTPYLIILAIVLLSTFILWLPFILKVPSINGVSIQDISFSTIEKHWDGPLYVIPAKTWYNISNPIMKYSPLGLSPKYFAAHLPLYPLTIKIFSYLFGYVKASVFSTLIASCLLYCFFFYFCKNLSLTSKPLALTVIFMFFTPRMFVVRSTPTPEPLFMLLILLSIYFFTKEKYLFSGIFGGLATATKTPAILLFFVYAVFFLIEYSKSRRFYFSWLYILLIPFALFSVFILYFIQLKDFFAYFRSGDNLHLTFPPFQAFNFQKQWVGSAWLEDILLIYCFYLIAIAHIIFQKGIKFLKNNKQRPLKIIAIYLIFFFLAIICVQHRDISRYSLPMLPFALITLEKYFISKKIIIMIVLLPALYFYAWNFMLYNIAPISDWTHFL